MLTIDSQDIADANTFPLKIVAQFVDTYTQTGEYAFTATLIDSCLAPILNDPGQTDPADYYYTGTTSFSMNAFAVAPSECPITYSCSMTAGPSEDLCTYNSSGSTSVTFDASTGDYSFQSTEIATFGS